MRRADLLRSLREAVTQEERLSLEEGGTSLVISEFNRNVLLEMCADNNEKTDGNISKQCVKDLCETLKTYLNQYMSDQPEGHKWIILASLYLTYIQGKPMHPVELLHIRVVEKNGKKQYYCPYKSDSKDTACYYCVSRYISENKLKGKNEK